MKVYFSTKNSIFVTFENKLIHVTDWFFVNKLLKNSLISSKTNNVMKFF